ncbi:peptidoglycan-binding domain-containing protein [Streptomyces yaizuensis]|uniref:Peptidoglycan-binding protein n=1 Tax=Streptomyces yaizuensis TaxID=2989713 RepID=A0ABQ5P3T1_9ACTN|nr:peptidoglycan-binding domain-containing protein [Streptomyces sp. YSPA8]GLF97245.1 peptidoglycan-binding protein [Streptomyces sp. YSPA8]
MNEPYEPHDGHGPTGAPADSPGGELPGSAPADDLADRRSSRRAPRRGRGTLLVGLAIAVVVGVSAVAALGLGGGEEDGPEAPGRSADTVTVARADLVEETEIDGALGFGPEVPFPIRAEGTVTWLPESTAKVKRGGEVLRVNDRPVVLLYGTLPMYRELGVVREAEPPADPGAGPAGAQGGSATTGSTGTTGTTGATGTSGTAGIGGTAGTGGPTGSTTGGSATGKTSGSTGGGQAGGTEAAAEAPAAPRSRVTPLRGLDVKQFEANLSALGYTGFTVDESFTELTAQAVRRWQKNLGVPQTGRVGIGDVVYGPGEVRVAGTGARVGDQVSGTPVSYTSTSRMVTVNAKASNLGWARRGTEVTVDLPDGRAVQGTIASVGRNASAPDPGAGGGEGGEGGQAAGDTTVAVVITFASQRSLGRLESGPVTVRYSAKERPGVLAVPVAALVALAEGGHALELADGGATDGAPRYLAVKTGLFADGKVEVSGDGVREGLKVRIPK